MDKFLYAYIVKSNENLNTENNLCCVSWTVTISFVTIQNIIKN